MRMSAPGRRALKRQKRKLLNILEHLGAEIRWEVAVRGNQSVRTSGNQESTGVGGDLRDGNVDNAPQILIRNNLKVVFGCKNMA